MRNRVFTVDQANRTLPLVRRVAEDVVRDYRELERIALEYRQLRDRTDRGDEEQALLNGMKQRMAVLSEGIDGCVAELREIGCEMTDQATGTVDFPSVLDDRPVCLCWQSGEDRVEYWHEITEGLRSRKPLPVTVAED